MQKTTSIMSLLTALFLASSLPAWAQEKQPSQAAKAISGPAAVDNQLAEDQKTKPGILGTDVLESWDNWKSDIDKRTGLNFGLDYNALGFGATASLGDNTSASGVFRLFGTWNFFGRGTGSEGGIVFKLENRHSYTDVAPSGFAAELGYAGLLDVAFSDQGWRMTHLFWRQGFSDGRGLAYAGFLDITDYADVYALSSPWTGFSNLAFQTGSGTIGGLPDGALGAMVGGFVSDNVYLTASLVDANGDTTDLGNEAEAFFDDFETFTTLEIGWTPSKKNEPALILNNYHLTFWHIDERPSAGTPEGWGVAFSASKTFGEQWLTFLRGGWAEDGGSWYEGSLSAGFGYQPEDSHDQLGVALNIARPNPSTYGDGLDDQLTGEIFYNLQVADKFTVIPSVQLLGNPALNPDEDFIAVFGLRARVAI